jgi:photosystem II stability/assembly factor-like uncharacterized protein
LTLLTLFFGGYYDRTLCINGKSRGERSLPYEAIRLPLNPRECEICDTTGESWQRLEVMQQFPHAYTRAIAVKEDDSQVIFVGHGNTASPTIGSVQRSQDGGKTWETLPLPGEPNSYIICIATHPSDPTLVLASTLYGQLFMSNDAGDSWRKVRQEFSEVRSLAWMPS